MKNLFASFCVLFLMSMTLQAQDNLLSNGGFEKSSTSFLGTTFDGWDKIPAQTATVETADKVEGVQSMRVTKATATSREFNQSVDVSGFDEGTEFSISGFAKLVKSVGEEDVLFYAYFTRLHQEGQASDTISEFVSLPLDEWKALEHKIARPQNASRLYVGVKLAVGVSALFDNFAVYASASDAPELKVVPSSFEEVSAEINTEVTVGVFTLIQKNLTGMTNLEITGQDAQMFKLSAVGIPGKTESTDITVTYKPTAIGHHEAFIHITNRDNAAVNPDLIKISGVCHDSQTEVVFTVSPEPELPEFSCVVGETRTATILVHSENLVDYPMASIEVVSEESGFYISQGMLSKNADVELTVTFSPLKAGSYESRLTISCKDANKSFVYTLKGTATPKQEDNIDWQTKPDFSNIGNPLAYLYEPFDNVERNKTLVLDGWQNIASVDARPWWGFINDEQEHCAKALAYQYATPTTGEWTLRLITPALDYVNATSKVFSFRVMAEFIPDGIDNPAKLELYYLDASQEPVFEQKIELDLPSTNDENGVWIPFEIHLENQPIADAFFMEFRFTGLNGNEGTTAYYIDDVTWGAPATGIEKVNNDLDVNQPMYNVLGQPVSKEYRGIVVQNGKKYILR